jgi:5-formyltetrahydrofolate cyclo-ligase
VSRPVRGERTIVRRRMREARRLVDPERRSAAAQAVADRVAALGLPRPGTRVATYIPLDGEIDPAPVAELARDRGCSVYAPAITSLRRRQMCFRAFPPGRHGSHRNRWGITEPTGGEQLHGRWLGLVIVPCVAFDAAGSRLGMGAGFYDRHFAFLMQRSSWRRPLLLGVAFDLQRVEELPQCSWDVPLWGVVTESAVYGRAARGLPPGIPREAK